MKRFESQSILFTRLPKRLSLHQLRFDTTILKPLHINVWRNHAFEPLVNFIQPFMQYGGWKSEFNFSGYDDSLMFVDHSDADIEILWIDCERYLLNTQFNSWIDWMIGRLQVLRSFGSAPIIVATWFEHSAQMHSFQSRIDRLPGIYFADIGRAVQEAGVKLLDQRASIIAGTPISNSAQSILARKLACHWLPAALLPPIKAVIVDLDNTLHEGVLGEDGLSGVMLTPMHRDLQKFIKSLPSRGVFIALVSRNERHDVELLLEQRIDYPLSWDDFSAAEVSWDDKAIAIRRIANALRIAPDAVLFVDDNIGELSSVKMQLPQVHSVLAHEDASLTQRAIEYFPGLWRWGSSEDDAKRVKDLKASTFREVVLANSENLTNYYESLEVSLTYRNNPIDQLSRITDLCNKTNQFNLALSRLNEVELAARMEVSGACVTSVQLSDRLSNSGLIAVIVAERVGENLVIKELCISCRALGRKLEDEIIIGAICGMPLFVGCDTIEFRVSTGPRNQPALDWLAKWLVKTGLPDNGVHNVSANRFMDFTSADGLTIIRE